MMPCLCVPKLLFVSVLLLPLCSLLASPVQPMLCHADESSALLRFKETFVIACSDPLAHPQVLSWTPHGDCCSWDGVECDDGHVIGLNLTSSCLFGPIHPNSSLFELKHLQWLSLAQNNFNYSPIPQELALLSTTLTHLDLSSSYFTGQIPSQISMLSKLVYLDLGCSDEPSPTSYLQLKNPIFTNLVQNLTKLEVLVLNHVNISSSVPNSLSNLSSLSTLYLRSCNLVGEFPSSVFLLPNLEYISIRLNEELTGHLPQFHQSPLKLLSLRSTSFSGELPNSVQNLPSLSEFDVGECHFIGPIPSSLGNLTNLTRLDLRHNLLQGPVQKSIFSKLVNLEFLYLNDNNFSGTVKLSMFHEMRNLSELYLGYNQLSVVDDYNGTLANLHELHLGSCNLRKLPNFLRHQQNLYLLYLVDNKIHGQVPGWFCNISTDTLGFLALSKNLLTGLEQCNNSAASWVNLQFLFLGANLMEGSLPTPPPSITIYTVSNNSLTGELPHLLCNLSSLSQLELGYNNLSGLIPPCLGNMFQLTLTSNNFSGTIPDMCTNGASRLEGMDLSHNHLQGKVPRSLANCTNLRVIDVGHNAIHDTFPLCMGKLQALQLLILRSNKFHGPILEFPNLRIITMGFLVFCLASGKP